MHDRRTTPPSGRLIRFSAAAVVVGIGTIAAYVSYRHALEVVRGHGETGPTALLSPLTIDGLVYVASMVLLDAARRGDRAPALARWALALGIGATVAVNVLHGIAHGPVGATIAAWPAVTLVVVVELLMGMIRRGRTVAEVVEEELVLTDDRPEISHPQTPVSEVPGAGQQVPRTLEDAVMSARAAGMSVRDVAKGFGITRYRVEKLDKQREPATT